MKLKEIRLSRGVGQKELARRIGTDEPMLSRFENYKCLPIPSMLSVLAKELGCTVDEIYEPHEIYLQAEKKRPPATKRARKRYRMTVDLPSEAKERLRAAVRACGYKDITAWIGWCYARLSEQYGEILLKEKDSTSAGKQESGA